MRKLFISIPMRDRTEKQIKDSYKKMKKLAELLTGEKFEVINSYIKDEVPQKTNASVYFLGQAITKLAEADVVIGPDYLFTKYTGCLIEKEIALNYGIEYIPVNEEMIELMMPDVIESEIEEIEEMI